MCNQALSIEPATCDGVKTLKLGPIKRSKGRGSACVQHVERVVLLALAKDDLILLNLNGVNILPEAMGSIMTKVGRAQLIAGLEHGALVYLAQRVKDQPLLAHVLGTT